jgi:CBS domain-containing protein
MIVTAQSVTSIRVKGHLVGIVGLQDVMEAMKAGYGEENDEVIGVEMVNRLALKNYIPDSARENYSRALVREFRIFLGQPVSEEVHRGLEVLILGPGCGQCSRLETDVRDMMAEMNLPGELIHVTDVREIGKYGLMGMPALVINKKVVSVGTTPEKKKIRRWLEEVGSNSDPALK